jgi:hypothetical protein
MPGGEARIAPIEARATARVAPTIYEDCHLRFVYTL